MAVVTARVPDEELDVLKRKGLNISTIVQEAVHRRYMQERMLQNSDALAAMDLPEGEASQDIVRRLRDDRAERL